jgi:RND superfamily putative drug exporter
MPRLVSFALSRPRAALAFWAGLTLALGAVGLGVEDRIAPSSMRVEGSESARARTLVAGQFGAGSASVPVLLKGPAAPLAAQGRALVATLSRQQGVTVVSPWTRTARRAALRPDANTALIIASASGSSAAIEERAARVERLARARVGHGVRVHVTGMPALTRGGVEASTDAVHRAELIALPLLLLILLLVFRSPLAAAIPVVFGAGTVAAGYGLLALLTRWIAIDTFALALATMMGLALAVDYSLLMVSRYREERTRGGDEAAAASAAAHRTGHTLIVAGLAVVVAMVVGAALSPSQSILSAAVGVSAVAALAVLGASLAVPATLVVLGSRLASRGGGSAVARTASATGVRSRALRSPALAGAVAVGLAALALPALGLRTGGPSAADLPAASIARQDADAVRRAMGPGWGTAFELVAVARHDPITTPARLGALERMQRRIARDPDVAAVIGPGSIAPRAARLRQAGRLAIQRQRSAPGQARGLRRLDDGVQATASGVTSLRSALDTATGTASRIDSGSTGVANGVGSLNRGLRSAADGAQSLTKRITGARDGTKALAAGVAAARAGAKRLSAQVGRLDRGAAAVSPKARALADRLRAREGETRTAGGAARTQRQALSAALDEMQRTLPRTVANARAHVALGRARSALAATDPASALDTAAGELAGEASRANAIADAASRGDMAALAQAARSVSDGLGALQGRLRALGTGVNDLAGGTAALLSVLRRLGGGTEQLGAGVDRLRSGIGGLVDGVREGERRTSDLAAGIDAARSAASGLREQGAAASRGSKVSAQPGFFDSGYFILAALQGAGNGSASPAYGVNVDRGGQAARVLVVPRHGVDDPRTRALYDRLAERAHGFARFSETQAAVGGPAAMMIDHERATATSFPQLVLVLTLVTSALIGVLLRSLLVPLIGAVLNLLTVGATLGLLTLLFQGANAPLGGPGHLDGVAVTAIFGVIFALSIDYQVFIVARVREEFLRGHDARVAVERGLTRTAGVVTGAALSMFGVFLAFALADVAILRQFGVGLAIAVALDATVVRLVLLPAALRLAGHRAWWRPGRAATPALATG